MKRLIQFRWLLLFFTAGFSTAALSQSGTSLSSAKTLFVEAFNGGNEAVPLHDSVVHQLSKSNRFRLVQSLSGADAIVKGTSRIWIRGYTSTNARTPANNRQAVYGGYLSLQVVGADGQPLWSWLATPGKLAWSNIVDELSTQVVKRLLAADTSSSPSSADPAAASALAHTRLTGGGATFPAPLYQKWFEDFEQLHRGVTIQYSPVGSQSGVEALIAGRMDFAGSDVAPDVFSESASHLPRIASVLGAVVPIYNLNGSLQDLHFTPEALADIYLGRVHRWNDPEIRRSNKGVDLPDVEIAVIHRSDGSGTTWIWSNYLSKVSPAWSSNAGRGATIQWAVGTGAEGSEGMADAVQKTPNSIGYVELAYAIQHQLSFAGVRNHSGEYIHADLDSLTEAATSSGAGGNTAADITDPPGRHAYPIAAFTWLLLPATTGDSTKKVALTELLRWILTTGQKECSALGYAPLPRVIVDAQLQKLNALP